MSKGEILGPWTAQCMADAEDAETWLREATFGKGLPREVIEAQRNQNGFTNAILDAMQIPEPSLSMWVIYERPRDYPTSYVVRRHAIGPGWTHATPDFSLHATLEEARAAVPLGAVRMERNPQDEPQILECWI